jgi:lipopolysaccharide export system permease protein
LPAAFFRARLKIRRFSTFYGAIMIKRTILFRALFAELVGPFLLGLAVFTFILLMNKVLSLVDLIINKGVDAGNVLLLLWYLLPSFMVLTVPVSVLLAIMVTLGRLSGDMEITAMKASGISLYQLAPPIAAFCALSFAVTAALTLYFLPLGNTLFRVHAMQMARQHSEANLQEGIFNDAFEDLVVYLHRYDREEKKIFGIMISDRREPDLQKIVAAKHAEIIAGPAGRSLLFRLFDGSLHLYDRIAKTYQYAVFATYEMNFVFEDLSTRGMRIKYRDLTLGQLFEEVRTKKSAGESTARARVEIHERFAFPFACLVFGLLGLPLGISWRRGGRSYGFVISLIVVLIYYVMLTMGETLAKSGHLPVFAGMWLPNALFGLAGAYFFRKTAREEPLPLQWIRTRYIAPAASRVGAWVRRRLGTH